MTDLLEATWSENERGTKMYHTFVIDLAVRCSGGGKVSSVPQAEYGLKWTGFHSCLRFASKKRSGGQIKETAGSKPGPFSWKREAVTLGLAWSGSEIKGRKNESRRKDNYNEKVKKQGPESVYPITRGNSRLANAPALQDCPFFALGWMQEGWNAAVVEELWPLASKTRTSFWRRKKTWMNDGGVNMYLLSGAGLKNWLFHA